MPCFYLSFWCTKVRKNSQHSLLCLLCFSKSLVLTFSLSKILVSDNAQEFIHCYLIEKLTENEVKSFSLDELASENEAVEGFF